MCWQESYRAIVLVADRWCDECDACDQDTQQNIEAGLQGYGLPHEGDAAMRVHDLRHTFAYLTAKAGADIGDLQYLLGHEDISQTMRYRGFIQSRATTFVSSMRCA